MTAVKERATTMIRELSDESVTYVIKILEGLQGLEQTKGNPNPILKRISDIREGINCSEHDIIEVAQ